MNSTVKKIKLFLLGLILVFPYAENRAQVTIGMDSPPVTISLLQLKDQNPDENNVTSSTGGLVLPRVALVDVYSLEPFALPSEAEYQNLKRESVGMVVYNVTVTATLNPGVHFWDGERWAGMASTYTTNPNDPITPDPETNVDDPESLLLPNSYILPQGGTLIIPLMKGYATWKQILDYEEADLMGNITVELLWQTKMSLVRSISLIHKDNTTNSLIPELKSQIKIETNNLDGNALVVMKMDGVIMWSWHIWVTNYDSQDSGAQRTNNGYTFMDRNLGALYMEQDNLLSGGLLYQWGRKDPFPGTASLSEDNKDATLYDMNNNAITISKEESLSTLDYRPLSVHNPMTFYYINNGDWAGTGASEYYWNRNGQKGITDPCPSGWRVPPDVNVWDGLPTGTDYRDDSGLDWDKDTYNGGYYPAAGYRESGTGNLVISSHEGFYWVAKQKSYTNANVALRLSFRKWNFDVTNATPKAQGNTVRCVKDE